VTTLLTIIVGLVFMLPLLGGLVGIVAIMAYDSADELGGILFLLAACVFMNLGWIAYRVGITVTPWLSEVLQ
jgi:hypothetical protein